MGRYLNELISTVQKEVEHQRELLEALERQQVPGGTKGSKDAAGSLNRGIQRLQVLEALRERDRHRPRRRIATNRPPAARESAHRGVATTRLKSSA